MTKKVAILDYGSGNLFSIKKACQNFVNEIQVISDDRSGSEFTHLLLPGVGTYQDAMDQILQRNLQKVIYDQCGKGVLLLGICVGMQVMTTWGHENGKHKGLDLISGQTDKISVKSATSTNRIPNIGWSAVTKTKEEDNKLFSGLENGLDAYFAHSYEVLPDELESVFAVTQFDNRPLVAAINTENIYGVQFHPEKSGEDGLLFLKNFFEIKSKLE